MHITYLLKQMRVFRALLMETKTEYDWKKAQILHSSRPIFEKDEFQKLKMPAPYLGLNNPEVNSSFAEFAEKSLKQK